MTLPKGYKILMEELKEFKKFVPANKQKEFEFLVKDLQSRGDGISLGRDGEESIALTADGKEIFRLDSSGRIVINEKLSIYDVAKRFWNVVKDTNPYIYEIAEFKRKNKLLNERVAAMDVTIQEMDKRRRAEIAELTDQKGSEKEIKSKKRVSG